MVLLVCKLTSERNLFKTSHLQFFHCFKDGMVIMRHEFKKVDLVNEAARKMLKLPVSAEYGGKDD